MNRNAIDFYGRMEAAKAIAMRDYNRGQPSGAGRKVSLADRYRSVDADSNWWFCEELRRGWDKAKLQILNDFAAACLNPIDDQPDTWEFR